MDSSGEPFLYNGQLEEEIPQTVTHVKVVDPVNKEIGYEAFMSCSQLMSVELCEGLERINEGAFQFCRSLTSITIPSTVKDIDEMAFEGCNQLRNAELNEGLEQINNLVFAYCTSL
jgi:hypothetical protein